jgi:hypothetical protein
MLAVAMMLASAALSGNPRQVRVGLLAALVIDVQAPILLLAHPAAIEYWDHDFGIHWIVVPHVFLILFGVCAYAVLALGRRAAVTG